MSELVLEKFIKQHPQYTKNSYVLRRLQKKEYCPPKNCWKQYYRLLYKNKNQQAAQVIERIYLSGTPILEILKKAITPTMRHIADRWSHSNITVYEEHRMSFNIRMHLIRLDQFISTTKIKNPPLGIQKENDNWDFLILTILGYLWLIDKNFKIKEVGMGKKLSVLYS